MSYAASEPQGLSWPSIARLGLVQAGIGAVVVLMTSTLNRVMVVELGLLAAIPGLLVGVHFAVQILRPRMGFGSDRDGRRITWIVGGMALTSLSGLGAAAATAWMTTSPRAGLAAAVVAFFLLGVGVSAGSTPFLAYMAERVPEQRMAGAAALTWILMIAGIIVTATVAGSFLDPYSPTRLVQVAFGVTGAAFVLTLIGVAGRSGSEPIHLRPSESSAEPDRDRVEAALRRSLAGDPADLEGALSELEAVIATTRERAATQGRPAPPLPILTAYAADLRVRLTRLDLQRALDG